MSAWKSTLINALVGKDILETRNEASTNRIHRVFNKAFDDGVTERDDDDVSVYMDAFAGDRVCFVDTPGVNSVRHPAHRAVARTEIKAGRYDVLVYVINARYSGTTDDSDHLRYVLKNKPQDTRIIFVLTQLDAFGEDDSIDESLRNLRASLEKLGISEPRICPVSAKAGRLARRAVGGADLDRIETLWYEAFSEYFGARSADLSAYYGEPGKTGEIPLLRQCGLIGLEQVLLMA
jgi:GTPase Era involved in 16S rRNA processing